jgi:hypothetical protein
MVVLRGRFFCGGGPGLEAPGRLGGGGLGADWGDAEGPRSLAGFGAVEHGRPVTAEPHVCAAGAGADDCISSVFGRGASGIG